MKQLILSALIVSLAITVNAQKIPERKSDKPGMMERKRHHQGMEFQKLNLTEDQKAKLKEQKENFRKQMEELKKNDNITVKEWKAKAENLRKEQKNSLDRILTPDQKAQIEKSKVEAKERHEKMSKERGERMKTQLGLSDAQAEKMQLNRKEMGEKMKVIKENKSLSIEQKKEQMKDLMKKNKEYMKSVLTEEQLNKLKEGQKKRSDGERGERRKPEMKKTI